MTNDELARSLHDKASRGIPLAPAEQTCLEEWYARQDQEEAESLARAHQPTSLAALRADVAAALARVQTAAQRLRTLAEENDKLRQEIAALQQRATQPQPAEPA
jgi:hypothetical protein